MSDASAVPTPAERQVRVFISSTFRDMHAERDHLVTVVFPELRERLERLGLEFFDVDLRWGVPAKDADGETANSWEYCRQWIDRVEPFFVCMLGQRYGWVPEPEQLKAEEDRQRQQEERRSITDMEIRHAVLATQLKRRSYFYLRAREAPATATEYVDPPPSLEKLETLKDEVRTCGRPVWDYPCEWTGTGFTGMEEFGRRVLEDLWSGVLRDERYVGKDVWREVLATDPETDARYTDEAIPVPRELWEKIVALAKPPPKDPLDAEREQMDAFAASRLRWFQGRTHELQQLTHFIHSTAENAPRLAVVAAVPGLGKSALIAELHQQLSELSQVGTKASAPSGTSSFIPHPSSFFLITHFVGATERSANAHSLVGRLLAELDRSGIEWPGELPAAEPKRDFNSQCIRLARRLGDYAGERRIILLLDALNQLSDGHDLIWLPHRLGQSVRIVVSCLGGAAASEDRPEGEVLRALESRQTKPLQVSLGPLSEGDVRTIVVEYLEEYCKVLDACHVEALCALPQARNPLYLLVMLGELRTLGGNDMNKEVAELITSMPADHPDTVSLFRWMLRRLEVFGTDAVMWWCMYLTYGRIGMASHELTDLLSRKLGAGAAATALRIARGLRRYLQRRGAQLDFFHGQLRQAVIEQYGLHAGEIGVHSDIASYFRNEADPDQDQSWNDERPRSHLELAFHLGGAQCFDDLVEVLCDLRFVEARCRLGQVFELIDDYQLALEQLPESRLELREELADADRTRRWTENIIGYSRKCSDRCERMANGEAVPETAPAIPEPPTACEMPSEDGPKPELEQLLPTPTRRDRLEAFATFLGVHCHPLSRNGKNPGFVLQHALNSEPVGLIRSAASAVLSRIRLPYLRRRWPSADVFPFKPALKRILAGHTSVVTDVDVTANGQLSISASCDGTLRVWNNRTGRFLRTLEGHERAVSCVSMSPDGRRAVSGSTDQTIRVWDPKSGLCLHTLTGHSGELYDVSVTPDGRRAVSTSHDGTMKVWDVESGACLNTLRGHNDVVVCACVRADGKVAVSGGGDCALRVWDLEDGTRLRVLRGHSGIVTSVCMTPDCRVTLSGSRDHSIRVWDTESGTCTQTLEGHDKGVNCLSVTADGRRAVSSGDDKSLRVWDLETGACLRVFTGYDISSVSITPDGRIAVTGSDDNLLIWSLTSGTSRCPTTSHRGKVSDIHVTRDGRRVLSVSQDETMRLWDIETCECLHTLQGHDGNISGACFVADEQRVVSGGEDATLRVWDLASGLCLHTLTGHASNILCVSVSPDGRRAASGGHDATLRVWNLETGRCVGTHQSHEIKPASGVLVMPDGRRLDPADPVLGGHRGTEFIQEAARCIERSVLGVQAVGLTADGTRAVTAGDDCMLRVWDLASGACLRTLVGHGCKAPKVSDPLELPVLYPRFIFPDSNRIPEMCVMRDDCRVMSAGSDNTLRVWDLQTGACLQTIHGDGKSFDFVKVMPDGLRALSMGSGHTLRVWDLHSGACLLTIENLDRDCNGLGLSDSGHHVATTSSDRSLYIWDLRDGSCQAVYVAPSAISTVAFSGDNNTICAGTEDGQMLFLDMVGIESGEAIKPDITNHGSDEIYELLLRRGLETSRREMGEDHAESLAHLTALAFHLEATGNGAAAADVRREHELLAPRVAARLERDASGTEATKEHENVELSKFIAEHSHEFVGRDETIREILAIVRSPVVEGVAAKTTWGACVTGAHGSGKSALFSKLHRELENDPALLLLANAAGGTRFGSSLEVTIRRWIGALTAILDASAPPIRTAASSEVHASQSSANSPERFAISFRRRPKWATESGPIGSLSTRLPAHRLRTNASIDDAVSVFHALLGQIAPKRRVVILLDSIDHFETEKSTERFAWFDVRKCSDNIRFIATGNRCLVTEEVCRWVGVVEIQLPPLTIAEAEMIGKNVLKCTDHALDSAVLAALVEKKLPNGIAACGNPLWLALAIEQLNKLDHRALVNPVQTHDASHADQMKSLLLETTQRMAPDLTGLYHWVLEQCEKAYGEVETRAFATAIACSKSGWRDGDLQGLLPRLAGIESRLSTGSASDSAVAAATWNTGNPTPQVVDSPQGMPLLGTNHRPITIHPRVVVSLRRGLRAHLLWRAEHGQIDFADPQMRRAAFERYMMREGARRLCHSAVNDHLDTLPDCDPLCRLERMPQLIAERNAWRAAWYYATLYVTDIASTDHVYPIKILTSWVVEGETGEGENQNLAWILSWLQQNELTPGQWFRLASNLQFGLLAGMTDKVAPSSTQRLCEALRDAHQRLRTSASSKAISQRELALSEDNVGDMLFDQGDLTGAIEAYRSSEAIMKRLLKSGSDDANWLRDLALSQQRIGKTLLEIHDWAGALAAYRESLSGLVALASTDPDNSILQDDISICQGGISKVSRALGDQPEDCSEYEPPGESFADWNDTPTEDNVFSVVGDLMPVSTFDPVQQAVGLLNAGRAQEALDRLRPLIFPHEAIEMDDNTELEVRLAFVHALWLTENVEGVLRYLSHLPEQDDPRVRALSQRWAEWQQGLSLMQKLGFKKKPPLPPLPFEVNKAIPENLYDLPKTAEPGNSESGEAESNSRSFILARALLIIFLIHLLVVLFLLISSALKR